MTDKTKSAEDLILQLKGTIEANDLVHRRVAEKLGVSITTFSRWMNSHTLPISDSVLRSIEKFLKTQH